MTLIDLSQPLAHDGPNCPVHPPVLVETIATHERDDWQMELVTMASHTGSHLDAPLHKLAGGKSLDDFPIESFVAPARLADLRGIAADAAICEMLLREKLGRAADLRDCAVLLCTGWGERRAKTEDWLRHSPFLSPEGAQWLVAQGVRGVGIDHYSIGGSREPDNARTHEILLGAGVWILEDLHIPPSAFDAPPTATLWCLPINLPGASGAWCRPVLACQ